MAGPTTIPFGDAKAVKRWSTSLFLDILNKAYWDRKFVGEDDNSVIQRLTDLESDAGDTITFDLSVQLRNKPTTGDQRLEGKEENLRFASDEVYIDQMRHGVSAGGKMSRKRTVHNMRRIARDRLSDYWSKYVDQMNFIYLSGARGTNEDFYEDITWAGFAGNPIQAPDAGHLLYGGDATSKATVDAADTMSRTVIERATVKARMMRSQDPTTMNMLPININGEGHYVCVMSPFQEHSLRTSSVPVSDGVTVTVRGPSCVTYPADASSPSSWRSQPGRLVSSQPIVTGFSDRPLSRACWISTISASGMVVRP
jgi:N4-gp56 family major capsid protein